MQVFGVTRFNTLTKNVFFKAKKIRSFNIFWSGIVSLTRRCLKIFPRLHSFSVSLSLNFVNCKIALFKKTFWKISSLEKCILSQIQLGVRSSVLYTNFWSSSASIEKKTIFYLKPDYTHEVYGYISTWSVITFETLLL